jgi:hypothetical protein
MVSQKLKAWRYSEFLILYSITFALRKNTDRCKLKYYKIIFPLSSLCLCMEALKRKLNLTSL